MLATLKRTRASSSAGSVWRRAESAKPLSFIGQTGCEQREHPARY
jgi:hypothetical protein